MNFKIEKMLGGVVFTIATIVSLSACSTENGVDGVNGKDGVDGKDGVSVTDTLYVIQKDSVIFAGDTIYISQKDTVLVKDTVIFAGDTIVISKKDTVVVSHKDTVYIANGGSENGGTGTGGNTSFGTLVDERDGQTYRTTKIGDQVWMAENLNYAYLQSTAELDSSSFCPDNKPANCQKYGRLYLWSAAMDSAGVLDNNGRGKGCGRDVECYRGGVQGVCPKGWHLPGPSEFEVLIAYVYAAVDSIISYKTQSMEGLAVGIKIHGNHLRAHSWDDGFDTFGFSALPVGYSNERGYVTDDGVVTRFWSSSNSMFTPPQLDYASCLNIKIDDNDFQKWYHGKNYALSVRCLKD